MHKLSSITILSIALLCAPLVTNAHEAIDYGVENWKTCKPAPCEKHLKDADILCTCKGKYSGNPFVEDGKCTITNTKVPVAKKKCFCVCDPVKPKSK